jgi:magnesium-transporting ATPase (P-type)
MSFFGIVLTFSIAIIMSLIAYLWLSKLYSSMKIQGKQLIWALIASLIISAIPVTIFLFFNPQKVNIYQPFTYAWEIVLLALWVFILSCRAYFHHFGKKNLVMTHHRAGST